jgi:hypothetical protein
MTATTLTTGTVAGFVLIIDPVNETGKYEKLRFSNADEMSARLAQIQKLRRFETECYALFQPTDSDETERDYSFEPSSGAKVGDLAYKMVCRCCNGISWFLDYESRPQSSSYLCDVCSKIL